jgi:[Skp1-protein]-hydroxyproline N-acetylglucosaminyltransferase
MIVIDHKYARGPCFARAMAADLYQNEDFYMQIDSHMRFAANWDESLEKWFDNCQKVSPNPVLSTYPPAYFLEDNERKQKELEFRGAVLIADKFDERDGFLRTKAKVLDPHWVKEDAIVPSAFVAAGFVFTKGSFFDSVKPYDCGQVSDFKGIERIHHEYAMEYVFFGEETNLALRMWLSGGDFFAPPRTVVYHLWTRQHRPTFSELFSQFGGHSLLKRKSQAERILKETFKKIENSHKFERTLEQYSEFSGVDVINRCFSDENKAKTSGLEPKKFYNPLANIMNLFAGL